MPQIPQSTDAGPAQGLGGLMSVRERAGYSDEQMRTILSQQDAGNAIRQLGAVVSHAGATLRAEEIRLATQEESTSSFEALVHLEDQIRNDIPKDPSISPAEYRQAYLDKLATGVETIHGGLKTDAAKFRLRERAVEMASGGQEYFRRLGAQKLAEGGLAQLDTLREEAIRRAQTGDEHGLDVVIAEHDARMHSLIGIVPETTLVNARQAFETGTSQARFNGLMLHDPTGNLATRVLKDHPDAFPGLDLAHAAEVAKTAGREVRRSSLFTGWDAGTKNSADLHRALLNGDLTATQERSLLHDRAEKVAKGIELQMGRAQVEAVLFSGDSPRPGDGKYTAAVDEYWAGVEGPKIAQLPPDQQLGHAAEFAAKVGHVPDAVLLPTRGDLMTYSPNALQAARFVNTLQDTAPGLLKEYKDQLGAANAILTFSLADPTHAVERAKELASVPADVKKLRLAEVHERDKKHAFADYARSQVVKTGGIFGWTAGPFGSRPDLPTEMVAEMQAARAQTYAATGSWEAAERTMAQVASTDWGYTSVTGPTRMQKLPPDKLYGQPGYGPDEMRQDVLTELVKPAIKGQNWGSRFGTNTPKDIGWLGVLQLPNGGVATEYSVPISEGLAPADAAKLPSGEMPSIVPGMTKAQIELMRTDIIPNEKTPPPEILKLARSHALEQIAHGKSPFFDSGGKQYAMPEMMGLSDKELASRTEVSSDLYTAQSTHPDYAVTLMTDQGPVPLGRWRPDAATSPTLRAHSDQHAAQGQSNISDARRQRAADLLLQRLPGMLRSEAGKQLSGQTLDDLLHALQSVDHVAPTGSIPQPGYASEEQIRASRKLALDALASGVKFPRELLQSIVGEVTGP